MQVENVLVSSLICDSCVDTIIQSYFLLHNIRKNNEFFERFSNMLLNGRYIYKDEDKIIMNLDMTDKLRDSEKNINFTSNIDNTEGPPKLQTLYQCCTCHMKFSKFNLWCQHHTQHTELLFKCEHCSSEFASIHLLVKHRKEAHLDKLSYCHICNLILKRKRKRKHFKRYHENDIFICDICSKCCYSKVSLEIHISLKHVELVKSNVKNKKHKCPLQCCDGRNQTCLWQNYLHTSNKCIPYLCAFCNQGFVSKELLEDHIKHKHLICKYCNKTFQEQHLLDVHLPECGTDVINPNKNYTKELNFTKKNECKKQIDASEINKVTNNKKSHIKSNNKHFKNIQKFMCDQCGIVLNHKSLLKHSKIHKDQKQCKFCHNFFSSSLLKKHLKIHFKEKKYNKRNLKCTKCDYSTHSLDCFKAHNNRVHLQTRPFQCSTCKKVFYSKVTLNEHSKIHSGLKPEQCHQCGNRFLSKKALMLHLRIHTGEKPYACDLCDEKFLSASRRQAHRIRKHFEPTVPCEICSKKYYTKSYLRTHIRKCHSSELKSKHKMDKS